MEINKQDFKYTIIARSCVGGWVHNNLDIGCYTNPFIWSMIEYISFRTLIENYDTINFYNIKFFDNTISVNKYLEKNKLGKLKSRIDLIINELEKSENKEWYLGIIDDSILISYMHARYENLKKREDCRECKNGIECVLKIYLKRVKLMKKLKPLFVVGDDIKLDYNTTYNVIYVNDNNKKNRKHVIKIEDNIDNYESEFLFRRDILSKQIADYILKNFNGEE
jgi:hypothetical protein